MPFKKSWSLPRKNWEKDINVKKNPRKQLQTQKTSPIGAVPFPNSHSWLLNKGGPNYLLVLGWPSKDVSKIKQQVTNHQLTIDLLKMLGKSKNILPNGGLMVQSKKKKKHVEQIQDHQDTNHETGNASTTEHPRQWMILTAFHQFILMRKFGRHISTCFLYANVDFQICYTLPETNSKST